VRIGWIWICLAIIPDFNQLDQLKINLVSRFFSIIKDFVGSVSSRMAILLNIIRTSFFLAPKLNMPAHQTNGVYEIENVLS
jgi:hypothetical protein